MQKLELTITEPKQLLVEGPDDQRLFQALARKSGIQDIQVRSYNGKNNVRPFLNTFKSLDAFDSIRSLAIVADADNDKNRVEDRIRDALSAVGLPSPPTPLTGAKDKDNALGLTSFYLVVPHAKENGMLEDVCLLSVSDDPVIACVDAYFQCVKEADAENPKEAHVAKARLHAFLASRQQPGLRLGEAAERGIWNFEAKDFEPLKSLLKML